MNSYCQAQTFIHELVHLALWNFRLIPTHPFLEENVCRSVDFTLADTMYLSPVARALATGQPLPPPTTG